MEVDWMAKRTCMAWNGTRLRGHAEFYSLEEPPLRTAAPRLALEMGEPDIALPGVSCYPGCGAVWATTLKRIHRELPDDHPLVKGAVVNVDVEEFKRIAADVRQVLQLPPDLYLAPGTSLGFVRLEVRRRKIPDFEWPGLQTLVISRGVARVLTDAGITGWRTEPVIVTKGQMGRDIDCSDLLELVVEGRGGVPVTDPLTLELSRCDICGRVEHELPLLRRLELDPDQSDGSDIFRFDEPYSGYRFVTERFKAAVENAGLRNCKFVSLEEWRRQRNFTMSGYRSAALKH
jgi:hypothetical protein